MMLAYVKEKGYLMTTITDFQNVARIGGTILQHPQGEQGGIRASGTGLGGKIVAWWNTVGMSDTQKIHANQQIVDNFVHTIRAEKGDHFANMASSVLSNIRNDGKSLKGHIVQDVLRLMTIEEQKLQTYNQSVLNKLLSRGDVGRTLNCLDGAYQEVAEELGFKESLDHLMVGKNPEKFKREMMQAFSELSDNGRKPVSMSDARNALKEILAKTVEQTKTHLDKLDTCEVSQQEYEKLRDKVLSGHFIAGNNISLELSELRIHSFFEKGEQPTSHSDQLLDKLVDSLGLSHQLKELGLDNRTGRDFDIKMEFQQYLKKEMRNEPECKTTGLTRERINDIAAEKLTQFLESKTACLDEVQKLDIDNPEIKKSLALMIVETEALQSPEQVKALWHMHAAVDTLLTSIHENATPTHILNAFSEYQKTAGNVITNLPKEVRTPQGDVAFRYQAMNLGFAASLLSTEEKKTVFEAITSPKMQELSATLAYLQSSPLTQASGSPLIMGIRNEIEGCKSQLAKHLGVEKPRLHGEVTTVSQDMKPLIEKGLDVLILSRDRNGDTMFGVSTYSDEIRRYEELSEKSSAHKHIYETIQSNHDWDYKDQYLLAQVMEHPSSESVDQQDRMAFNWLVRGASNDILLKAHAKAGKPLTAGEIWQAVIGEPIPQHVNEQNMIGSLVQEVEKRAVSAVKEQDHNAIEELAKMQLFNALFSGLSWQGAIEMIAPDAKLTMDHIHTSLTLSSLKEYTPENAYGQTVDIHRWHKPTEIRITHSDGETHRIDPNDHEGLIARGQKTPDVNDPVIQDLMKNVRDLCKGHEPQVQRTSQFLTQASGILFRTAGTGMGLPIDEHGPYSFQLSSDENGAVHIRMDLPDRCPATGHLVATVHPDGSYRISEFAMQKK